MKRLFAKIFFWFWLAMAVVVVVFVVSLIGVVQEPPPHLPRLLTAQVLDAVGHAGLQIVRESGPEGVRSYLEEAAAGSPARYFLYREGDPALSIDRAPERFRDLLRRARAEDGLLEVVHRENFLFAKRVQGNGGTAVFVVAEYPEIPPIRLIGPLLLIPVGAVIFVGALLCYWLARSVTSPLRTMSDAATQLAAGNLDARVGNKIAGRHDELGTLAREFDRMADRVESLLSTQQRLLRDVSHELRSPLTRLNLALELVRQKFDAPKDGGSQADALDRIELESGRLNKLIGELLTLARLDSETELVGKNVNVEILLKTIVDDAQFEAAYRRVSVRIVRSCPCEVVAHLDTLYTAVENVVRNAVRHTAAESTVEVAVEPERTEGRSDVVVRVRDHGPGVPEEELAKILRPFYSLGDSGCRHGGSGLGLAIGDRVVRRLGGSLTLSNATGGGLIVEIRVPGRGSADSLAPQEGRSVTAH